MHPNQRGGVRGTRAIVGVYRVVAIRHRKILPPLAAAHPRARTLLRVRVRIAQTEFHQIIPNPHTEVADSRGGGERE